MEQSVAASRSDLCGSQIRMDREIFMDLVVTTMGSLFEDTVGSGEAGGFISLVGLAVGEKIQEEYLQASGASHLDRRGMIDALLDMKRRIGSDFYVVEETEQRIVLGNRRCPFGELAKKCPSLCMLTANVCGHLAAESQGYARVDLPETIAAGASECRIVINLDPDTPGGGRRHHRRAWA
ncbi:methanogen output domain 1-containing protein [Methylorubrum rhodesianum]|uniref:methanogen output domain 1-containing protein n=1 Tax=Methylorubrum TaxID=2282523 RepID=UPI0018175ECD|nr:MULTISPECIES: methanogen output domain 1-containing protein [Methylorubrum]MBB5760656.1 putative ArsR family transcriptional regulator [Methylorubrum rhodesianum]